MVKLLTVGGHYIIALAVIGCIGGLIAIGSVASAVGVPVIVAVAAAVIGGKLGLSVPTTTTASKVP